MTTQYGAPLTGEQMKLLRAAGLPDNTRLDFVGFDCHKPYRLPADHAAYTLLEAGWLDGRNVALWFGGEKAPDDWDGNHVMFRNGLETWGSTDSSWEHKHGFADIIAYTRKTEYRKETVNACQSSEAEVSEVALSHRMTTEEVWGAIKFCRLIGLIKPEPARAERFWQAQPNGGAHVADDVKAWVRDALNFERSD